MLRGPAAPAQSDSVDPSLNVPQLLRQYGLRPDRRLGQNFLVSPGGLARVVEAADLAPDDAVLEIGPGVGSLTVLLAARAQRVVAVELDERLRPALEAVLRPFPQVRLVFGDILKQDIAALMGGVPYKVAANIPYYITSAVIRHLLGAAVRPERVVLTVQREVAGRITAQPPHMSLLALSVQVFGEARLAARLPAGAFYPRPQVDSAVVRLDVAPRLRLPEAQMDAFFRLAKAGFAQRRKTLRNALAAGLGWKPPRAAALLEAAGLDPRRRAETLSLDEWVALTAAYAEICLPRSPAG